MSHHLPRPRWEQRGSGLWGLWATRWPGQHPYRLPYANANHAQFPDLPLLWDWTPTPVTQIPGLPPLQDALSTTPQQATTLATPDMISPMTLPVTIPMPQDNTGPGTISSTTVHNVATMANQAPGFGRGLPVARASPMQVGTLAASASPMQVGTLVASPHRTPGHRLTAEEALLQGATLPCSPQQEAQPLLIHHITTPYAFVFCIWYLYYLDFCIFVPHVFFSGYRVNIFAWCSRPYCYVFMICFRFSHICVLYIYDSRLPFVVVYALSTLYSATHCIIIPDTVSCIILLCSVL